MSRDGKLTRVVAGVSETFRLPWGQLIDLQETLGLGPWALFERLCGTDRRTEDVSTVLMFGLVGAGSPSDAAQAKVERWLFDLLPAENVLLAQAVLAAALVGTPEEEAGNVEAAAQESN